MICRGGNLKLPMHCIAWDIEAYIYTVLVCGRRLMRVTAYMHVADVKKNVLTMLNLSISLDIRVSGRVIWIPTRPPPHSLAPKPMPPTQAQIRYTPIQYKVYVLSAAVNPSIRQSVNQSYIPPSLLAIAHRIHERMHSTMNKGPTPAPWLAIYRWFKFYMTGAYENMNVPPWQLESTHALHWLSPMVICFAVKVSKKGVPN